MTARHAFYAFLFGSSLLGAALAAQDKPPAAPPVPAPPTTTAPDPAHPAPPTPTTTPAEPPAPGGEGLATPALTRMTYEITYVDLPVNIALAQLRRYGLAGWQLCQVEFFTEMADAPDGGVVRNDKYRCWLQRALAPAPAARASP